MGASFIAFLLVLARLLGVQLAFHGFRHLLLDQLARIVGRGLTAAKRVVATLPHLILRKGIFFRRGPGDGITHPFDLFSLFFVQRTDPLEKPQFCLPQLLELRKKLPLEVGDVRVDLFGQSAGQYFNQ